MKTMIDVAEALEIVSAHVPLLPIVELPLADALYRTLAEPVRCDVDYPPFDRAVMDGYAVRAGDTAEAPVRLRLVGQIAAGATADHPVGAGEAMRINTGAPMPPGADAVVRVEHTEPTDAGRGVLIHQGVEPGRFVTKRAAYVTAGRMVLAAGTRLTAVEIGAAASAGAARVTVHRRPRVAILSTGEELVEIDRRPAGAKIRNSNRYLLEALVRSAQAEAVVLGVSGDERGALQSKIEEGLRADLLCITGGISMGTHDLVPEVLEACGVTPRFRKMAIKPGRPTIFATGPAGTPVFALPGNPGSAFVGFELLVRPALALMEGRRGAGPQPIRATLRGTLRSTSDRRTFVPARVNVTTDGVWETSPTVWHGSGDSFGLATANGLIVQSPGSGAVADGEAVSVLLLDRA